MTIQLVKELKHTRMTELLVMMQIVLDMEPEDSGESTAAQTFFIWIDSKGKFFSEAFDFPASPISLPFEEPADYEDDQKKEIENFSSQICKDINI